MRIILNTLLVLIAITATAPGCFAKNPSARSVSDNTVYGRIIDETSGKGLKNVAVSVDGSDIGTVSNSDGYFSIFCPEKEQAVVSFSTMGYASLSINLDSLKNKRNIIRMKRLPVALTEVNVYGGDPARIVEQALKKIPENYSDSNDRLELFYRETVKKGRRYIAISEAALEVYKTSYNHRDISSDRVRIERGRKLLSRENSDTLAVKIVGGPNLALCLDIVKNPDLVFSGDDLEDFEFKMERSIFYDNRLQYVISFEPRVRREFDQFRGKLFIDCEMLALSRAEFEMLPDDKDKMTRALLHRRSKGLRFNPLSVSFVAAYKLIDGRAFLNYISCEMRFKCDIRRRLFSSAYTTFSEMVVVDREHDTKFKIPYRTSFRPRQIFDDVVNDYWDEKYWNDYNIIEPTESLENAVEKLKKSADALPL